MHPAVLQKATNKHLFTFNTIFLLMVINHVDKALFTRLINININKALKSKSP